MAEPITQPTGVTATMVPPKAEASDVDPNIVEASAMIIFILLFVTISYSKLNIVH